MMNKDITPVRKNLIAIIHARKNKDYEFLMDKNLEMIQRLFSFVERFNTSKQPSEEAGQLVSDTADFMDCAFTEEADHLLNDSEEARRSDEDILADKDQQAEDDYWDNHPEEAKRPPFDENLEKVILGAFKKVFPERFTPTDNSDVEVVSENVMWVGFKDYDIRIEKDPEFNDGHLHISVHSKEEDGYMLHQDGEPCKLIVREEDENE